MYASWTAGAIVITSSYSLWASLILSPPLRIKTRANPSRAWKEGLLGGPLGFCAGSVAGLGCAGVTGVGVAGFFVSVFVCVDNFVEAGCFVGEHAPDLCLETEAIDDFDDEATTTTTTTTKTFTTMSSAPRLAFPPIATVGTLFWGNYFSPYLEKREKD